MGFTAMGASRSTLSIVDAVISLHCDGHLPSPVTGLAAYSRLARRLVRVLGLSAGDRSLVTDLPVKQGGACDTDCPLTDWTPAEGGAGADWDLKYDNLKGPRHTRMTRL